MNDDSSMTRRSAISRVVSGTGALALAAGALAAAGLAQPARAQARAQEKDARYRFGDERKGMDPVHRIIRDIERPPAALLEKLKATARPDATTQPVVMFAGPLGTCGAKGVNAYQVGEAAGRSECKLGADRALSKEIHPVRYGLKMMGPAFTVLANDHLMPLYATTIAQPGDVLVIDARSLGPDVAIWGGGMTTSATNRKLGGVVIDGQHCDHSAFHGQGGSVRPHAALPIFSRGTCAANTTWEKPGSINVPVTIGGRIVFPGDLVVGGDDGVVVIPKDLIEEALERAVNFRKAATEWVRRELAGETWFEVLDLKQNIERLNIPEFPR